MQVFVGGSETCNMSPQQIIALKRNRSACCATQRDFERNDDAFKKLSLKIVQCLSSFQFQFDDMDRNRDGNLQKSEVNGIVRHVPHEECLFGFMISSDVDQNHVLSREEWNAAFAHVGKYFTS